MSNNDGLYLRHDASDLPTGDRLNLSTFKNLPIQAVLLQCAQLLPSGYD